MYFQMEIFITIGYKYEIMIDYCEIIDIMNTKLSEKYPNSKDLSILNRNSNYENNLK